MKKFMSFDLAVQEPNTSWAGKSVASEHDPVTNLFFRLRFEGNVEFCLPGFFRVKCFDILSPVCG